MKQVQSLCRPPRYFERRTTAVCLACQPILRRRSDLNLFIELGQNQREKKSPTRFGMRAHCAGKNRFAVVSVHDEERLFAKTDEDVAVVEHLNRALTGACLPVQFIRRRVLCVFPDGPGLLIDAKHETSRGPPSCYEGEAIGTVVEDL